MFAKLANLLAMHLLYWVVRGFYASYSYVQIAEENRDLAVKKSPFGSYALSFWHEHVIMGSLSQIGRKTRAIASRSGGGRMIGFVLEKLGHKVIYGSQNKNGRDKGGRAALIALLKEIKSGFPVAFTVDGSVGPRRYCKRGIIELSRSTGAPILPMAAVSSKYWEFNTWDRLKLPKPFAKVYVYYGKPIIVPPETPKKELELWQKKLADAMNESERLAAEELKKQQGITIPLPQISEVEP